MKPAQLAQDLEVLDEWLVVLDDGKRAIRAVLERSYRRLLVPTPSCSGCSP
ncbi:hypothetical protein GCM10018781_64360 [Kitasatospora indigofera]|uniref:Uncharacterized protein n=1 Tax=Kitasatospora indigofera TaxID=67307 RepID=A0A919GBR8_9ACTN|nr:hypothetical protein GCM10018781_64360 [Kitasatospora indigofera]